MKLFPLFADLQGRGVVAGGGDIAARKIQILWEASVDVQVAPALVPELTELAERPHPLGQRRLQPEWLDQTWLVVAISSWGNWR